MSSERILVTSALPYANGPIHFGHIAGAYLPADIFVRYKRMRGADIVYICGTDEHGVAITIGADQAGISPQEHTDKNFAVIKQLFDRMKIQFDHFSRTSRPPHYTLSQRFFTDLYENGHIEAKNIEQLFCDRCDRFLADRYVYGVCPKCGDENARGDECPSCGAWLDPQELDRPRCKICDEPPRVRSTRHWYLKLQDFQEKLEEWFSDHTDWKENVMTAVKGWLKEGLSERPITRDMSWGVPVPLKEAAGKVLYVWFDAPIGYISSTIEWAESRGEPDLWRRYWQDEQTKLYHFIGKDNIVFHCIVWPAMLMGQNEPYVLPTNVPANEFYNLEGRQFSKSDGWYIDIDNFFDKYPVDVIRYTIAANAPETKDSEFTWNDFQNRNNAELANTFGNFVNRTLTFVTKHYDGKVPSPSPLTERQQAALDKANQLVSRQAGEFDHFRVRQAVFTLMEVARLGNRFFDEEAPWKTVKQDVASCGTTLFVCCQLIRLLTVMCYPVMPDTADTLYHMLGYTGSVESAGWDDLANTQLVPGSAVTAGTVLFRKIEEKDIQAEKETMRKRLAAVQKKIDRQSEKTTREGIMETISVDDFKRTRLVAAKILAAEPVPGTDKLLKLQIDMGSEQRQIVSGIAHVYSAEELIGRMVIVVANLQPVTIRKTESNGMLLAACKDDQLRVVFLADDVQPGWEIG